MRFRSVLRAPGAIAVALCAGALAYAYVAARGAPAALVRLATLGGGDLAARGGVVLDVRFPPGSRVADETAAIAGARRRLLRAGADRVDEAPAPAPADVRLTAVGVRPERADELARGLGVTGALALRPVVERGPLVDAIAHADVAGTGVRLETDAWTSEADGAPHEIRYLDASDRAALVAAVARLAAPAGGDAEILIAREERPGDAGAAIHYRTYVVGTEVIVGTRDIASATAQSDAETERPVVDLAFDHDGAERFGDWTAANVGHKLAIVVDGEVISAPVINSAIRGGRAIISMGGGELARAAADAHGLADALGAGDELPIRLDARVVDARDPAPISDVLVRGVPAALAALAALLLAWLLASVGGLARAPTRAGRAPDAARRPGAAAALAGRVAVTLGVPLALALVRLAPLPGTDAALAPRTPLVVGAIGVMPILTAYVLVELLALAVPAWRRRRHGDRTPLAAAVAALAAGLAVVQAWLVTRYLAQFGAVDAPWLATAAMAAGVLAHALGAAAITRWGLGSGWAVVLAGATVDGAVRAVAQTPAGAAVWLAEAALVGAIALVATRTRLADGRGAARRLPLGGVAGAALGPALLATVALVLDFVPIGVITLMEWTTRARELPARLVIAAVGGAAFTLLWSRGLAAPARRGALALGGALAVAIAAADALARHASGTGVGIQGALVAAAVADVVVELRARARGRWTRLAILHDVDAADAMLAAAAAPGAAPRLARGLHARALFRFFAPMMPIEILERQDDR